MLSRFDAEFRIDLPVGAGLPANIREQARSYR